jgi:hypothetical protein
MKWWPWLEVEAAQHVFKVGEIERNFWKDLRKTFEFGLFA